MNIQSLWPYLDFIFNLYFKRFYIGTYKNNFENDVIVILNFLFYIFKIIALYLLAEMSLYIYSVQIFSNK